MTDYPLRAKPRISEAGFITVLGAHRSPAAPIAGQAYAAAVAAGIDPAVLLAIFGRESTYGTAGVARSSHSWGNQRSGPPFVPGTTFTLYPDWLAGARACVALLVVYADCRIRPGVDTSTVRKLPYVWAPSADGNAPDAYGAFLAASIEAWSRAYPVAPPAPAGLAAFRCSYNGVRIRGQATTAAGQVGACYAGDRVTGALVSGSPYVASGKTYWGWIRLASVNGRAATGYVAHAFFTPTA